MKGVEKMKGPNGPMFMVGFLALLLVAPTAAWTGGQQQETASEEAVEAESTEVTSAKYREAPMLAELVRQGELPPVVERLPESPRVVEPLDAIGEYGGTVRITDHAPLGWGLAGWKAARLFKLGTDMQTIIPNLAEGYTYADDYKSVTIHLRKGVRWSDGHPLTSEDFLFWYNDVLLQKELTQEPRAWTKPGDEVMRIEAVDPYNIKYTFDVPYPLFIYHLSRDRGEALHYGSFLPKHYLQEFHITYNENADEIAKSEGFERWYDYFTEVSHTRHSRHSVGTPTVEPWIVTRTTTENTYLTRNPYYWAVDTEGNQLPYIDEISSSVESDSETLNFKILSGGADFVLRTLRFADFTLLKQGEERGNYKVHRWEELNGSVAAFRLNHTHADPVLRELYQDVRFKQALSLGIDRDEINEIFYFGLATPRQATNIPDSVYFESEFAEAYASYDPQEANRLLDEIGLQENSDGVRLRPDGRPLRILLETPEGGEFPITDIAILISEQWKKIGIELTVRSGFIQPTGEIFGPETDMVSDHFNRVSDILFTVDPERYVPMSRAGNWGPAWYEWFATDGTGGEEPPPEIRSLFDHLATLWTNPNEDARVNAGKALLRSQAENLWTIGTVGLPPQPAVVSNRLRNVPDVGYSGYELYWVYHYDPVQFYLKD